MASLADELARAKLEKSEAEGKNAMLEKMVELHKEVGSMPLGVKEKGNRGPLWGEGRCMARGCCGKVCPYIELCVADLEAMWCLQAAACLFGPSHRGCPGWLLLRLCGAWRLRHALVGCSRAHLGLQHSQDCADASLPTKADQL